MKIIEGINSHAKNCFMIARETGKIDTSMQVSRARALMAGL
jgi:hypothetical protein